MTKSSKISVLLTDLRGISTYQAGITQASAFRAIKKLVDGCLRQYGITTTQWFMIGAIYDSGAAGITMTRLSGIIGTNLPFITNSVNVLVHHGIIMRASPHENRRVKVLRIDSRFALKIPLIEATLRRSLQQSIYAHVSQTELLTYIRVLYTFNALGRIDSLPIT